jgi:type II secretory pathway component PulM
MRETFEAFWRARTERERLLLSATLWLSLLAAAPALVWQSASHYRSEAKQRLQRAEALHAQAAAIDPAALVAARPRTEQDLQDFVGARALGLAMSVARVERQGPDRLRFVFEPGDSLAALRLVEALTQAGLSVDRVALVRVDGSDLVAAELDVLGARS